MSQPVFTPGVAFTAPITFTNAAGAPATIVPENPLVTDSFGGAVVVQSGIDLTITLPDGYTGTITLTWLVAAGPLTLSISLTDQQTVVLSDATSVSVGTFAPALQAAA